MSDEEYSDDEETKQYWNINSYVLVAVDCNESMFKPHEALDGLTGFQTALRALHKVVDGLVLDKTTKNKVAVAFFHSDSNKRSVVEFDTPMVDGLINIKKLAYAKQDVLDDYNSLKSPGNFSHFLIECKNMFKKINKKDARCLLFVTGNGDPCDDPQLRFEALSKFQDFKELKIAFDLLPVIDDFDYESFYKEAFIRMKKTESKFYYNLEFLTKRILDAVRYKTINKNMRLHISPSLDADLYIPCLERSYSKSATLLPNIFMTRDLKSEVTQQFERKGEETYTLQLSPKITERVIQLTAEEKENLYRTDQVKLGLTILHAYKTRQAKLGLNMKKPHLLKPLNVENDSFNALWEACVKEDLTLLCSLKYKAIGNVHSVELIPKTVEQCRQFLMITVPHSVNLKSVEDPPQFKEDKELAAIFDDLVECATIKDYDVTKVTPYKHATIVKYCKQELLGRDYEDIDDSIDLVEAKHYGKDVESIVESLKNMYPSVEKGGKRTKSSGWQSAKRGKK